MKSASYALAYEKCNSQVVTMLRIDNYQIVNMQSFERVSLHMRKVLKETLNRIIFMLLTSQHGTQEMK